MNQKYELNNREIETIKSFVIFGIYKVSLEKQNSKDLFIKLKQEINRLFDNYKQNHKITNGCCYCKQKTEWGICNAYGVANKSHEINYCPICGEKVNDNG